MLQLTSCAEPKYDHMVVIRGQKSHLHGKAHILKTSQKSVQKNIPILRTPLMSIVKLSILI